MGYRPLLIENEHANSRLKKSIAANKTFKYPFTLLYALRPMLYALRPMLYALRPLPIKIDNNRDNDYYINIILFLDPTARRGLCVLIYLAVGFQPAADGIFGHLAKYRNE
jgi:hypothetical protein